MAAVTRAFDAKIDLVEGERTIVAYINTDAIDRYRTVIVPKGAKLDNYNKNKVVLLNHDFDRVVGKNLWIKIQDGRLVAKTKFPPAELSEDGDRCFRMYQEGYMCGFSISFDPIDYGPPTPDEIRARPELAECRCMYRTWDLLEYSCVAVPANPEAVALAVSRGYVLPEWVERAKKPSAAKPELPPLEGRTYGQVKTAFYRQLDAQIRAMGAQAVTDAIDLAKGKV